MNTELTKWLDDYDNGKEVESVEMGGISDGYEMAIQDCAIEIIRALVMVNPPEQKEAFSSVVSIAADSAVDLLDKKHGFSGAQVGAAKNLAAVFWRQTPIIGLEKMRQQDPDRIIRIRKSENGCPIKL